MEIFSLTGAGFNCSAYQQPGMRRGLITTTFFINKIALLKLLRKWIIYNDCSFNLNFIKESEQKYDFYINKLVFLLQKITQLAHLLLK